LGWGFPAECFAGSGVEFGGGRTVLNFGRSKINLPPTSCRKRRDGSLPLGTPVEYARVDCQ